MQTPFDPQAFYGQPAQPQKSIARLMFWLVAAHVFILLINLVIDFIDLDWDTSKYIFLAERFIEIGIWCIPLFASVRITNKKLKIWGVILSVFLIGMHIYWFVRLLISILSPDFEFLSF